MVQGIASLDAQQPQTQPMQPDQGQASPDAVAALGKAFTSLSAQELTQLRELSDDLKNMSPDKLTIISQIIQFMKTHSDKYDQAIQILVTKGLIQPGDMPPQYVPSFFDILDGIVKQAMAAAKAGPAAPEGQPQMAMARGGIAQLRKAGTGGDKILAHINPSEAAMLQATRGGGRNPTTGLPEYGLFDDVGDFFKKAAGVVLPVALGFMGVPPIFAGAIGSGLGAMINGAKPQEALSAALMGGVGGAVFSGIGGMASGQGFMAGVNQGFQGGSGPLGQFFGGSNAAAPVTGGASSMSPTAPSVSQMGPMNSGGGPGNAFDAANAGKTGFFDSVGNWVKTNPGYAMAGAGLAGLALGSMGSGDHGESVDTSKYSGPTRAMIDAERFPVGSLAQYTAPKVNVVPTGNYLPTRAAKGGEIDARIGGHLQGPGTGTSDSIPAKLSDGEFVMTAKAVRGAGGGDRVKGARRMYQLMHQFEKGI
jgi:hypothetical protein